MWRYGSAPAKWDGSAKSNVVYRVLSARSTGSARRCHQPHFALRAAPLKTACDHWVCAKWYTGTKLKSSCLLTMRKAVANLMENSIQIAWNYLDRTGELGEPEIAA